jgi:hypothetical protein
MSGVAMTTATTYTSETTYVGRCSRCRKGHKVTVTREITISAFNGRPHTTSRIVTPGTSDWNGRTFVQCECGADARVAAIQGRVTDKKCGARCRNSIGPVCECECGGEHHGDGHL